jgi:hypothetical protein
MTFRLIEETNFCLDLAVVLGAAPNKAARRFFNFVRTWQAARSSEVLESVPDRS